MPSQLMTEAKLRRWMQELGPRLIVLSAGICRDRHRAEEIVQEAFVKLWRSPPEGGEVVYPAWMRRVVTNLSINSLQRTRRPVALPEYSDDPAVTTSRGADERCDVEESIQRVSAAMGRLDESKRAILMLRAHEQLSYEEIAAHMGVPVGTVMSRLNRARAALIEEMKKDLKHAEDEPLTFEFKNYKRA
jgi:RNA polymerase sigma-70 factor (ECF subfamily)